MIKHPKITFPSISRMKLRFSNFSGGINTTIEENLLPINYAKMSYNTDFSDRSLQTGLGFKELTLPLRSGTGERVLGYDANYGNIDSFWFFERYDDTLGTRADAVFVHADDNQIYYQLLLSNSVGFGTFQNFSYNGKPNVQYHKYNDDDVAVLCSDSDYLAIWTGLGSPAKVSNTLSLTSICIHYERIFATVSGRKDMVRFSDDFDLFNWNETASEGGFIVLADERGTCNKVISFNDYVYIIREHGISRLSAYGDQSEFSVTHLFYIADKIFENTAVLCGDRIIFACSDGLYSFNGYSATRLDLKINKMFDIDNLSKAVACYFDGKYYLACCLDFMDQSSVGVESTSFTNNALIELDLKSGHYTITRGVDIIHLTPIVSDKVHKLAVCFGDSQHRKIVGELTHDGCFFGSPLKKSWLSPMSDFGYPDKIKIIRQVHLFSKYNITLIVSSESETRSFLIAGSDKISSVCPNIKGQRISLAFESNVANFYVSNPSVVVDLV